MTSDPWLPPGRWVELPGRGTTFVRDLPGPPGAPTVVLLHGLLATADLNWSGCYAALGEHFRVIALDHRGHGRGIRSHGRFRLEDCADDAVALADVLGLHTFIAVGYSMGGPIAQLLWHRHPSGSTASSCAPPAATSAVIPVCVSTSTCWASSDSRCA